MKTVSEQAVRRFLAACSGCEASDVLVTLLRLAAGIAQDFGVTDERFAKAALEAFRVIEMRSVRRAGGVH